MSSFPPKIHRELLGICKQTLVQLTRDVNKYVLDMYNEYEGVDVHPVLLDAVMEMRKNPTCDTNVRIEPDIINTRPLHLQSTTNNDEYSDHSQTLTNHDALFATQSLVTNSTDEHQQNDGSVNCEPTFECSTTVGNDQLESLIEGAIDMDIQTSSFSPVPSTSTASFSEKYRPGTSKYWSQPPNKNQFTRLIRLVQRQRDLWDPTVGKGRNNPMRDHKWDDIAKSIGMSNGAVARKHWAQLRASYRAAKHRYRQSGGKTSWRYFDAMAFLDGFDDFSIKNKPRASTVKTDAIGSGTLAGSSSSRLIDTVKDEPVEFSDDDCTIGVSSKFMQMSAFPDKVRQELLGICKQTLVQLTRDVNKYVLDMYNEYEGADVQPLLLEAVMEISDFSTKCSTGTQHPRSEKVSEPGFTLHPQRHRIPMSSYHNSTITRRGPGRPPKYSTTRRIVPSLATKSSFLPSVQITDHSQLLAASNATNSSVDDHQLEDLIEEAIGMEGEVEGRQQSESPAASLAIESSRVTTSSEVPMFHPDDQVEPTTPAGCSQVDSSFRPEHKKYPTGKIVSLIRHVQRNPGLWMLRQNKDRLHSESRERVWTNIANRLGMVNGAEARDQWYRLRSCYRTAKSRTRLTGRTSCWRFYDAMSFVEAADDTPASPMSVLSASSTSSPQVKRIKQEVLDDTLEGDYGDEHEAAPDDF